MNQKKLNAILKIGSMLMVAILLLTFTATATPTTVTGEINNVAVADDSNVTATILGGVGYIIKVANPKNTTIVADITVNITSYIGSAEFVHEISILPGHSNVVYKVGGLPMCVFGHISANVSIDGTPIAGRSGFVIFGLVVIFTT